MRSEEEDCEEENCKEGDGEEDAEMGEIIRL